MKTLSTRLILRSTFTLAFMSILLAGCQEGPQAWIRINQLGYMPNSMKVAVCFAPDEVQINAFALVDAASGKNVFSSENVQPFEGTTRFNSVYYLDFSEFNLTGTYYVQARMFRSPLFSIRHDVYSGTADFLLNYMRQQRCGYNPFYRDSCHTQDGFIIFHPDPLYDSTHVDVTGGWHDATDYLQYAKTSINAIFQMMLAYTQNPEVFGDAYDGSGHPGSNKIPDIMDEIKWGLAWMLKMFPKDDLMFKQIADDRDHAGFRLPIHDSVDYGRGFERPVYFVTGQPQGYGDHMNRTTGKASLAGKYASSFIAASRIFSDTDPELSNLLEQKAVKAYDIGKQFPGYCQTDPCRAPYFYEEENWVDDMELAAVQLYLATGQNEYLEDARRFGAVEPTTPWMGADTARHYQWYPFLNLGHYYLAVTEKDSDHQKFTGYLKQGLMAIEDRAKNNPFYIGVPFIWCSNNLVAAALTQCALYRELTGDSTFLRLEAAHRDWLFGCNPWGTSMIVGLPENGDFPEDTHSSPGYILKKITPGGLVDGPVYPSIFNSLKGLYLSQTDEYEMVQPGFAVYHDDYADYSTNEPTMDGTASLTYYLSKLDKEGREIPNK